MIIMEEQVEKQEDFGTKACNRCNKIFKRKSRFNFFCPVCARLNSNDSLPRIERLPAKAGYSSPAT